MPVSCSALYCTNRLRKGSPITFRKFPLKNEPLLKLWLDAVKRENWVPTSSSVLCSEHFKPSDFRDVNGLKFIKGNVVPSIFKEPVGRKRRSKKGKPIKKKPYATDIHLESKALQKTVSESEINIISRDNVTHDHNYSLLSPCKVAQLETECLVLSQQFKVAEERMKQQISKMSPEITVNDLNCPMLCYQLKIVEHKMKREIAKIVLLKDTLKQLLKTLYMMKNVGTDGTKGAVDSITNMDVNRERGLGSADVTTKPETPLSCVQIKLEPPDTDPWTASYEDEELNIKPEPDGVCSISMKVEISEELEDFVIKEEVKEEVEDVDFEEHAADRSELLSSLNEDFVCDGSSPSCVDGREEFVAPDTNLPKLEISETEEICSKNFSENSKLPQKKPRGLYKCEICKRHYTRKARFERHQLRHAGQKPFVCSICHKRFTRKQTLLQHQRIHAGHKPHRCEICKKSFSQKSTLVAHRHTHTGEKPNKIYTCQVCDSEFGTNFQLTRHHRVHSGKRPYKCEICKKNFSQNSSLCCHLRVHAKLI